MKEFIRKILWNIDLKIYLFKRNVASKRAIKQLKYEKDKNKRDKLETIIIGYPFSSKYDLPVPNVIDAILDIKLQKNKEK